MSSPPADALAAAEPDGDGDPLAHRAPVRRHLSERQADTVAGLAAAALEEVRATGYDGLTVRNVARRAGVAPATAYTYFASKDHLVAEVFWRRLQERPLGPIDGRRRAAARVSAAIADVADVIASEPELAAACTTAMLATDPDVTRVRAEIGVELAERLQASLGEVSDPVVVDALSLALSGAMLQAGMGYFPYAELADRMAAVAELVLGDR